MKKELLNSDKELLLKDLCARLPYGVMCDTTDNDGSLPNIWEIVKADMLNEDFFLIHDSYEASRTVDVKEVRPYLFPLSSMTEEQKAELSMLVVGVEDIFKSFLIEVEFYHKHHIDYRGLIEKSLALDATNLGIYE